MIPAGRFPTVVVLGISGVRLARDSVHGTAEELLAIYADERVQAFTEGHDLDVAGFLSSDNTVYLYAPAHQQRPEHFPH